MNKQPKKIIIVEDDKLLLTIFRLYIKELGHTVVGAYTKAEDAIDCLKREKADVVLLDINLPDGLNGIEAAKIIFLEYNTPIIYMTSYTDENTFTNAINYGVYGYLVKPIDKFNLGITIDLVCWRHEFEQQKKISEHLLNRIHYPVITMTLNGRVLYANDAAKLIFSKKDILNSNFYEWIGFEQEAFILDVVEETIAKGFVSKNYTLSIDGKKKYLQANYSLLLDEIQEPFAITVFAEEISELIELSESFKKIGSVQAALLNGMSQMAFVFDKDQHLVLYNPKAQNFYQTNFQKALSDNQTIQDVLFFLPATEIQGLLNNIYSGVFHYTERIVEYQ